MRFLADDDASAAVEFVVLLPVYLLLIAGLLTIGHLVMVRQSVVLATRFRAWEALNAPTHPGDSAVSRAFFPIFHNETGQGSGGVFETTQTTRVVWSVSDADLALAPADAQRLAGAANPDRGPTRHLASQLMNNGGGNDRGTIVLQAANGGFGYRAAWVPEFGIGQLISTPHTHAATLLPNGRVERRGHRSGQQQHPIEDYGVAGRSFRPSQNLYESPTGAPVAPPIPEGLDPPGLWNPDYRLGGTVMTEWAFVRTIAR